MKSLSTSGFTIIEVMLVLAISSLLTMGAIIGLSGSLNTQRYRDSVSSLQSLIQKQFSDVNNVSNVDSTLNCAVVAGAPVLTDAGVNVSKGKTDCVILGKLITTNDGKTVFTYNVIGAAISGAFTGDVAMLQASKIILNSVGVESYDLEWGASLKNINGTVAKFSVLIVRSPASGAIRAFIDPAIGIASSGDTINLRNIITAGKLQSQLKVCVKSDGSIRSDRTAIFIKAGAASSSSVETQGESTSGC
ncbi:MAG: prepilin-type N-terminal cleavage/methylation domain-containing protein [Candidatus Saccharibacteria bacterium]